MSTCYHKVRTADFKFHVTHILASSYFEHNWLKMKKKNSTIEVMFSQFTQCNSLLYIHASLCIFKHEIGLDFCPIYQFQVCLASLFIRLLYKQNTQRFKAPRPFPFIYCLYQTHTLTLCSLFHEHCFF